MVTRLCVCGAHPAATTTEPRPTNHHARRVVRSCMPLPESSNVTRLLRRARYLHDPNHRRQTLRVDRNAALRPLELRRHSPTPSVVRVCPDCNVPASRIFATSPRKRKPMNPLQCRASLCASRLRRPVDSDRCTLLGRMRFELAVDRGDTDARRHHTADGHRRPPAARCLRREGRRCPRRTSRSLSGLSSSAATGHSPRGPRTLDGARGIL